MLILNLVFSDHAWGGNYFVASGALGQNGGKILGEYPSDLTNDGPLVFHPGIVIPTTPLESLWNPVSQWFGVAGEDIDKILPNYEVFSWLPLLDKSDVYQFG